MQRYDASYVSLLSRESTAALIRISSSASGSCRSRQSLRLLPKLTTLRFGLIGNRSYRSQSSRWRRRRNEPLAVLPDVQQFQRGQLTGRDPLRGRRVRLFNPRRQRWSRHFRWSEEGTHIIGRTSCGRATVIALQLNHVIAVMVRREWVAAGWHPPID